MASIQPTGSTSETPSISYLIVDSSPLLTSPISSLRGIASNYLLTPEVVSELRDKNGRSVIEEGKLQLAEGFIIREPTLLAVSQG